MAKRIRNEGKDTAVHFRFAAGSYRIRVCPSRGTVVDGCSPDARYTGTCDRCGIAILNVHCFESRNPEYPGYMHVGIDCAAKMGVPLEELRTARNFIRDHERAKARKLAEQARAEARMTREQAMRIAFADVLDRIAAVEAHPCASDYEKDAAGRMVLIVLDGSWDREWKNHAGWLASIEDRLALTSTSKAQPDGGRFTALFTVYRRPFGLEGFYGITYINFLRDSQGNAYVYKGSRRMGGVGEEFTATFTVKGVDERDGLVSTLLARPSKVVYHVDEPEEHDAED